MLGETHLSVWSQTATLVTMVTRPGTPANWVRGVQSRAVSLHPVPVLFSSAGLAPQRARPASLSGERRLPSCTCQLPRRPASPLCGSLLWEGSVSPEHDFRPGRKPPPFLPPRHARLRRTVWVCLCVFVWGGRFEGRLPRAPRLRRGREPADRHGGVSPDFPLETSSSP